MISFILSFTAFSSGYPIMEFYMNKTGRPMLYSCSWPAYVVFSKQTVSFANWCQTMSLEVKGIISLCFIYIYMWLAGCKKSDVDIQRFMLL